MTFGLSSLLPKKIDTASEPQGGEGGKGGEEEGSTESEASESSDDTNGGGGGGGGEGGQAPGGPPPKPQGGEVKQPSSTSLSTAVRSQPAVSLPSVSTEGGPKTIPQIGVPKSQPFGAAIQYGKTIPSAGSKPEVSVAGGGGGQGVDKSQQKTEVKVSPQAPVGGGVSGAKTQADVQTTVPGVTVVKGAGEVKKGVTPQATVTTVPAPLSQPTQPAVTTAITTTAAIGKSTPSLDVSRTAPASTAGPKKVEQTVAKTVTPSVTSGTAVTNVFVNQSGVPASAATTAVTGLSLMGLQSREGMPANQGLLPTSDENNFNDGDMEGDMEGR